MRHFFALVLAFSSLLFASCKSTSTEPTPDTSKGTPTAIGTAVGSPSSATIDATGGSLMSPDGRLEIIIPANALSAATVISIQPVTNEAPLGSGLAFSLLPHGQQFSQPVTLRFHYKSDDLLGSAASALAIALQKDDRIWYAYDNRDLDTAAGTLSVLTTHFSVRSLYQSLRISPTEATIKVNASQVVTVQLVAPAASDDDEGDELSPLVSAVPYPNAEEVTWTLNGSSLGTVEDGYITAIGNTSTATYKAPPTTANMTSNPVAVTVTVDILGASKHYLISNITVLDAGASGRVSMSINVDGTRTYTNGGVTKTRTEFGSGTLVYDLPNTEINDDGGGARSVNWDEASFGGTTAQISDESQAYTVICSGGPQTLTDYGKTTSTFSSTADGLQRTGLGLVIEPDGNYTLLIGPPTSLTAAAGTTMRWTTGDCFPVKPDTSSGRGPVPFAQYFVSYIGKPGTITGKIDPAQPNRVVGSYHGTDMVTMFDVQPTPITMPFEYTITWDITLTK